MSTPDPFDFDATSKPDPFDFDDLLDVKDPVDGLDPEDAKLIREMYKESWVGKVKLRLVREWSWLFDGREIGHLDLGIGDSNDPDEFDALQKDSIREVGLPQQGGRHFEPMDAGHSPNVVISRTADGKHKPLLDLDLTAHLIPSSTTGHAHLYLNHEVTTEQYQRLLDVLVDIGIVQQGFARRLEVDGFCTLRLPWVQKEAQKKEVTEE